MPPTPEAALPLGDGLASLVPASGHLLHMATHIDVLCGDYQNVVSRNQRAVLADQPFTALRGADNFYTVYRIHNVHFVAYGAMFLAQKSVAVNAALELQELLPEFFLRPFGERNFMSWFGLVCGKKFLRRLCQRILSFLVSRRLYRNPDLCSITRRRTCC